MTVITGGRLRSGRLPVERFHPGTNCAGSNLATTRGRLGKPRTQRRWPSSERNRTTSGSPTSSTGHVRSASAASVLGPSAQLTRGASVPTVSWLPQIEKALQSLIETLDVETWFIPLGLGHPDHRMVGAICARLAARDGRPNLGRLC